MITKRDFILGGGHIRQKYKLSAALYPHTHFLEKGNKETYIYFYTSECTVETPNTVTWIERRPYRAPSDGEVIICCKSD